MSNGTGGTNYTNGALWPEYTVFQLILGSVIRNLSVAGPMAITEVNDGNTLLLTADVYSRAETDGLLANTYSRAQVDTLVDLKMAIPGSVRLYEHVYDEIIAGVLAHPDHLYFALASTAPATAAQILLSLSAEGVTANAPMRVLSTLSVLGDLTAPNVYGKAEVNGLLAPGHRGHGAL